MKSIRTFIPLLCLLHFPAIVFAQMPEIKTKINYGNNAKAGKFADVNGIKLYYEEYGNGAPMIMIHGNGGSIHDMGYQIEHFSRSYRVIAADSRCHGRSGTGDGRLTYEQMADDWAALMTYLKIDSAYIIGWSDGGILGLLLANHHPAKVKKLAAMGANLQPDTSAVYGWAVNMVHRADKTVDSMIVRNDTTAPWAVLKKHLDLLGNQPHIPLSDLKKIYAPTLVLSGDKDVITLEHTCQIFENIPKAHLCIFPGATHLIPVEDPVTFNRAVEKFFSSAYTRPDTRVLLENMIE
jgi:pimeloyl-ACP methyl ester carboxylesterase